MPTRTLRFSLILLWPGFLLAQPFTSSSQFGCKGDGISDDTACMQKAFSAILDTKTRFGKRLFIAPGTYKLTSTVRLQNITGAIIEGAGGLTRFHWAGPRNVPMFHFSNMRDGSVRDFHIQTSQAAPLREGIRIDNVAGVDPGHNTWEGISMEGTNGGIKVCFREANGGKDENNDFQLFIKNRCSNYSGAAWSLEHSQALSSYFIDNQCYGYGRGQACIAGNITGTAGAVTNFYWHGGFGGFNAKADFYINSAQQGITIQDFSSEGSARFLVTDGPSAATLGITVDNLRWASAHLAGDGQFIVYKYPGPFVLRNSTFLGSDYKKLMKIDWSPLHGGARQTFVIENCTFVGSNRTMASVFPQHVATRMEGFSVQNGDTQFTSLDVQEHGLTRVTVSSAYTAGTWENYIGVTDTSRPIVIRLADLRTMPEPAVGKILTVKDESGGAARNSITVTAGTPEGRIDGAASVTINTNYGFRTLLYIGNRKYVVIGVG
jgi:hypothetical protein